MIFRERPPKEESRLKMRMSFSGDDAISLDIKNCLADLLYFQGI